MQEILRFIKGQFTEDNGNYSSMRTQFNLWSFGLFAVWVYLSVLKSEMAQIDPTTLGVLGLFITGKFVQKFGEQKVE